MKLSGLVLLASFCLPPSAAEAVDATAPVDYTQRNTAFAPTTTVAPEKKAPEVDSAMQDKRFDTSVVDKKPAAVGDRRAAIDLKEARDKTIREKDSHRPEVVAQPTSAYNHREAAISTTGDTKKPPTVSKYQDSLSAASASNMARFPALDQATGAKINRFVFRKNAPDTAAADASAKGGALAITPENTVSAGGTARK